MKIIKLLSAFVAIVLNISVQSQNIGINSTGATPTASSILDLNTGNNFASPSGKGLMPPNVALTSTTDVTTVTNPTTSLLVYNTATAGATPNNVIPGYYYWTGTQWQAFMSSWSLTGNAGTTVGTNFLGTTDAQPFMIKVNNTRSGYVDYGSTENTSFGYQALSINSPGTQNAGFGYKALFLNSNGLDNTAIGAYTLPSNTSGNSNTATGSYALFKNTLGDYNTALGAEALTSNSNGLGNTATGNEALQSNILGNYNTATGNAALENCVTSSNAAFGNYAGFHTTTGDHNTFIGDSAGLTNTTGYNNIYIGYNADNVTTTVSNCIIIGNNLTTAANSVSLGNSSITSIKGQVAFSTYSDARIKDNVTENVVGLAFIKKLHPVTYHYNIDKENALLGGDKSKNYEGKYNIEKISMSGFIAQEVEQAAKAANYDFSGIDYPQTANGLYGLRYADFVVPLVKAIQEQQTQIENQNKKIEQLTLELLRIKKKLGEE